MVSMNPSPVRFVLAGLCLLVVLTAASVRSDGTPAPEVRNSPYLAGQLLVASPRLADGFLMARGIIVRRMEAYGLGDCLRITIGQEDEMRALVDALAAFRE